MTSERFFSLAAQVPDPGQFLVQMVSIASIAAVFVSWLQWLTARKQWQAAEKQAQAATKQLRLALFERRIVVRDALLIMVATITTKADLTDEQLKECVRGTKDAAFLFPKGIDDYCVLLLKQATEFHMQKYLMNQNQDPESETAKQRQINHSERVQWWFQQEQEIPRRFNTFLKVEE